MPSPQVPHEPGDKSMAAKVSALQRASVFSSAESSRSGEPSLQRRVPEKAVKDLVYLFRIL